MKQNPTVPYLSTSTFSVTCCIEGQLYQPQYQ
jgi:hypothetical protein